MPYPFKMWPACHSSPLGQIKVYCGPDSYKGHFNISDNVPINIFYFSSSFITDYQCRLLPPYRHIATPVEDISHHRTSVFDMCSSYYALCALLLKPISERGSYPVSMAYVPEFPTPISEQISHCIGYTISSIAMSHRKLQLQSL